MEKILAWNNEEYFEYLGKDDYCYRKCGRYGSSVLCDNYDN